MMRGALAPQVDSSEGLFAMADTPSNRAPPGALNTGNVAGQAMVVARPASEMSGWATFKAVVFDPTSFRRRVGTLVIIALVLVLVGVNFWSGVAQSIIASIIAMLVEGVGATRERHALMDAAERERALARKRQLGAEKLKNAIREVLRHLPEMTGAMMAKIGQHSTLPAADTFEILAKVTQAREALKLALGRLEGDMPTRTDEIDLPPPTKETP